MLLHNDIADVLTEKGGEFLHGYTYSGHPTCAAVASANLKLMCDTGIVDTVREDTAPYLQKCWQQLATHNAVAETRGLGMVAALKLKTEDGATVGTRCRDLAINNGLIMRAVRDTMIIAPHSL